MERETFKKQIEDKKQAAEKAKADAEAQEKEEQRQRAIAFKSKVKELIELCETKLAGTNYDKYWVQSVIKRFSTVEKLQPICDFLEKNDSTERFVEFINDFMMSEEDRLKKVKE